MLEEDILKDLEENTEVKSNEIVEIEDENTKVYDLEKMDNKKVKTKKKNKQNHGWNNLTKKQKTIILVCLFGILLLIIGILLFLLIKKDNKENEGEVIEKEPVIVNKENYSYVDGKLIFKDINKATVGEYNCENKDDNLCYVAYYSNEDNFDTTKYVYENGIDVDIVSDILKNRFVIIYDNPNTDIDSIILYDIKNNKELGKYKLVKELNDNSFILKNEEDLYGVISFDSEAKTTVDFKYSYIGYIKDSNALVVKDNNEYFLTDFNGKKLSSGLEGEIKAFNDKFISAKIDGNIILYNYNAERVTSSNYDYLAFKDGYVITIINRKLKVYDRNMNPMHYEEIKLASNKYQPIVTYNEDNVEIKREEAYTLAIGNDVIEIDYLNSKKENDRYTINLNEGAVSSKFKYLSYFDGILYIYKDEAKQNLLGSYTCTNPNNVTKDTTNLETCFLAYETKILNPSDDADKNYLPIYNNRYIFIQDGDVINLYDLNTNSKKATYKEVDAGFYNNEAMVNFEEAKDLIIVAKNTSDVYGAIKINNNTLERVIDFENKEIKKLKDNYIFKKDDNYSMYNVKTKITTKDIVGYNDNYIVVKKNDLVFVYSIDGKVIVTNNDLLYASLSSNYFVGIDEYKRINLYNYQGTNLTNNYQNIVASDYAKSYKIEEKDNVVKVVILDLNGDEKTSFTYTLEVKDEG